MKALRLIPIKTHNAYMNMAIDEAIFQARIQDLAPDTMRFYRWKPSAVSLGRFQKVENEVYVENCRKYNVDIVRRISGGGTVYHDSEGEITYSMVAGKKALRTEDVALVYQKISNGLIEAVKKLGVNVDFNLGNPRQCPNITVNGRKISGSAQTQRSGVVLQHGTFLLDVDLEKMFNFLRISRTKTSTEIVQIAQKKITSLRHEIGRKLSVDEVYPTLIAGFEQALNTKLKEGKLTPHEIEDANRLSKEKFSTIEWIFEGKG